MLRDPALRENLKIYGQFQLFAWGFQEVYLLLLFRSDWEARVSETARLVALGVSSCFIISACVSFRWFSLPRAKLALRGFLACVAACIPATAVAGLFGGEEMADYQWTIYDDFFYSFLLMATWAGMFGSFHLYRINRALELDRAEMLAASREAQLAALTNQINPHFLFNSFSLLRALVQRDPQLSREAIMHLAEMMRHSLGSNSRDTVSLADEVRFLDSYLFLERLRYEERLRVSAGIPPELLAEKIPPMLLHTLIQNAVKHGIDQDVAGLDLEYTLSRADDCLHLKVTNSGRLTGSPGGAGTGLENLRQRLKLLYGEKATLTLYQQGRMVVAEASWPTGQRSRK